MAIQISVMSLDFELNEPPQTLVIPKGEVSLGRDPENDVILRSADVSGYHAQISVAMENGEAVLYVTDLGSTNGTLVDSTRIEANTPYRLTASQRLLVSGYLIKPNYIPETNVEDSTHELDFTEAAPTPVSFADEGGTYAEAASSSEQSGAYSYSASAGNLAEAIEQKENDTHRVESALNGSYDGQSASSFVSAEETTAPTADWSEVLAAEANTDEAEAEVEEIPAPATAIPTLDSPGFVGLVDGGHISVDFEAKKLCTILVRVLHKGAPLSNVTIDGGALGINTTNEQGEFTIGSLVEGSQYSFAASKEDFIFDCANCSGSLDDDLVLIFDATQLFSISGRIIHKGIPLSGVELDAGPLGTTVTNSEGEYFFTGVPEGTQFSITPKLDGYVIGPKG